MDYVQVVKEAQEKSGLRETRLIYGLTGRDFSLRI